MSRGAGAPPREREASVSARWEAGCGWDKLEDGRPLRVLFAGVPGGGAGPDFRGAVIEIAGDEVRGDVEIHEATSGWRAHGHRGDPAYAGVVLHVVARNDRASGATSHASGRAIPVVVLSEPLAQEAPPPAPPCARSALSAPERAAGLIALGRERAREKAARVAPAVASLGPAEALYRLALEQLGGGANRAAFAELARRLPLAALLERCGAPWGADAGSGEGGALTSVSRARAAEAELRGAAAALGLRRAGARPLAAPVPRLIRAATLVTALWEGPEASWPACLTPDGAPAALRRAGLSRALAVEVCVNAVLPVARAAGLWSPEAADARYLALPSPGTYGRLRRLEGWLATGAAQPFSSAAALQGGLLLHGESCTKGRCGRCPLS